MLYNFFLIHERVYILHFFLNIFIFDNIDTTEKIAAVR